MARILPINKEITKEQWMERFVCMAEMTALLHSLSEKEMEWVRDAGYECAYEKK